MSAAILTVLDGLQAGSRTRLSSGGNRIGTGTDCAVVIADPAMRSDHFEVVVGDVTVIRAHCQLAMPDGSLLAPGSQIPLSGATAFVAGTTRFLLDPATPEPTAVPVTTGSGRRGRYAAAGGGIGVALMAVLGGVWLSGRGPGPVRPAAAAASLPVHRPLDEDVDRSGALRALRARIAEGGLAGVTVSAQPDGTVVASGLLGVGDEPAWSSIRQWFDARYGNAIVVVERFGVPGALPPLRIAAVWAGANPYVVNDRGDRLHAGAAVGDGWFVDRIAVGHVVVRRGSQTVALRYSP